MKPLKKIINKARQSVAKKKVIDTLKRDPGAFFDVESELLTMRGLAKKVTAALEKTSLNRRRMPTFTLWRGVVGDG